MSYLQSSVNTPDSLQEVMQASREWNEIFKVLKEKSRQTQILYPTKLSFRSEGEIEAFSDE